MVSKELYWIQRTSCFPNKPCIAEVSSQFKNAVLKYAYNGVFYVKGIGAEKKRTNNSLHFFFTKITPKISDDIFQRVLPSL